MLGGDLSGGAEPYVIRGSCSDLPGRWLTGRVRGSPVVAGWGAKLGYPALSLDAHGLRALPASN